MYSENLAQGRYKEIHYINFPRGSRMGSLTYTLNLKLCRVHLAYKMPGYRAAAPHCLKQGLSTGSLYTKSDLHPAGHSWWSLSQLWNAFKHIEQWYPIGPQTCITEQSSARYGPPQKLGENPWFKKMVFQHTLTTLGHNTDDYSEYIHTWSLIFPNLSQPLKGVFINTLVGGAGQLKIFVVLTPPSQAAKTFWTPPQHVWKLFWPPPPHCYMYNISVFLQHQFILYAPQVYQYYW